MTTITQVITPLPTAPNPVTQTPDEFDAAASAFVAALGAMVTEENTFGTQANTVAGEVNTNATTATTKASEASTSAANALSYSAIAAGLANYGGAWSTLTGAKTVPLSVDHLGAFWVLLENVADVTTEVPGTSTKWAKAFGAGAIQERASNIALVAENNGDIIEFTSGTFTQTFDTAANLGEGWSVTLRN